MAELRRLGWSKETMAIGYSSDKEPEMSDIMKKEAVWLVWVEDLSG